MPSSQGQFALQGYLWKFIGPIIFWDFDLLIKIDVEAWKLIFLFQSTAERQPLALTLFRVFHL